MAALVINTNGSSSKREQQRVVINTNGSSRVAAVINTNGSSSKREQQRGCETSDLCRSQVHEEQGAKSLKCRRCTMRRAIFFKIIVGCDVALLYSAGGATLNALPRSLSSDCVRKGCCSSCKRAVSNKSLAGERDQRRESRAG